MSADGIRGSAPVPPMLDPVDRIDEACGVSDAWLRRLVAPEWSHPLLRTCPADELNGRLPAGLPYAGVALEHALEELATVLDFRRSNTHPGMFAYVASPGLPTDPLAHAFAAATNQNVTGYLGAPGATAIEHTVVGWLCQLAGLDASAGGLFLGGGSWANLTALAVALRAAPTRTAAMVETHTRRPLLIAAESAHFSVARAAALLGLAADQVLRIPVDASFRMDVTALEQTLDAIDLDPDVRVAAVVATAGTTGIGAIDPLAAIGACCRTRDIWFHVDAAYGGAALLAPSLRDRLAGIELADSITIDLHKWAYLAFDASVLLYRDPARARRVFAFDADYAHFEPSTRPEDHHFFDFAPEVSRRARAVSAYLAWRHYGLDRLGRNIAHNAACADYLAQLVQTAPDCELISCPSLSICCFRYVPQALAGDAGAIDALNAHIVASLDGSSEHIVSPMQVQGRPVIRVCICSYRTEAKHLTDLLQTVRRIGQRWIGTDADPADSSSRAGSKPCLFDVALASTTHPARSAGS